MHAVIARRALTCAAALLAAGLLAACGGRELTHEEEITSWRVAKDRFMREAPDSPVLSAARSSFAPLPYFPISAEYRVPAAFQEIRTEEIIEMSTSTNERRRMRRIGTLEFTIQGQALRLTAFVDASEDDVSRLFVPFHDSTNGKETYPGGRYLELERTATGIYDLDFNRAYHPFCVFNPAFECPVPPRENRLAIPIRAGEKLTSS